MDKFKDKFKKKTAPLKKTCFTPVKAGRELGFKSINNYKSPFCLYSYSLCQCFIRDLKSIQIKNNKLRQSFSDFQRLSAEIMKLKL